MILLSDMVSLYAFSAASLWFLCCEHVSPCLFRFVDGPTCVSPSTGCASGSGVHVQSSMVILPHPWALVSCSCPLPLPLGLGWSLLLLLLLLLLSFELLCLCLCGHNCVTSFCSAFLPFLVIHASVLHRVILDIYLVLLIPCSCCMVRVLFCLSPIGHQIVLSCLSVYDQQLSRHSIPFQDRCQSHRRMLLPCWGSVHCHFQWPDVIVRHGMLGV